jgi:hypothetical protein
LTPPRRSLVRRPEQESSRTNGVDGDFNDFVFYVKMNVLAAL